MKKIYIWGTGNYSNKILSCIKVDKCEILGIIKNVEDYSSELNGYKLFGYSVLKNKDFDYVIQCDSQGRILRELCEQYGITDKLIDIENATDDYDFINYHLFSKVYIKLYKDKNVHNAALQAYIKDLEHSENDLKKSEENLKISENNCKAYIKKLEIIIQEKEHEIFLDRLRLESARYEFDSANYYDIKSSEELITYLINNRNVSLVRFGDGEFEIMQGKSRPWFQTQDDDLSEKLKKSFYVHKENVIVAIPDIMGDLSKYTDTAADDIRMYLKTDNARQRLFNILEKNEVYYDAYVTRPYIMYKDKEHAKNVFELFKKLWCDKNVLLVEGEYIRSGLGNDLFDNVKSMKRILCPAQNAFDYYEDIIDTIKSNIDNIDLILCCLGPTATIMAYDLADCGVQTIDLGQLDNEYEWYRKGATDRISIENKAVPELENCHIPSDSNEDIYNGQVIARIGC